MVKPPNTGALMLFAGIGEKRYHPGPLNSSSQLALMMGTVSSNSPGKNFAPLGNVASQPRDLLIIYVLDFVCAEVALTSLFTAFFFDHQLFPP
jgi:hypothetical protein